MKQSEFVRWLIAQGVKVEHGTKHLKLTLNGNKSVLPRHPAQELRKGTVEAVKNN